MVREYRILPVRLLKPVSDCIMSPSVAIRDDCGVLWCGCHFCCGAQGVDLALCLNFGLGELLIRTILQVELLRELKIQLYGCTLVLTFQCITNGNVNLRAAGCQKGELYHRI